MEENALFALKHNGKSSTVGQKAIEQLKEINNL